MSIIQVQGVGGRVASDRTSFVGVRVPPEIKTMVKISARLDKDIVRKLLKLVMQSVEGEVTYSDFSKVVESVGDKVNEEALGVVFTGLLTLVKCALRQSSASFKQQNFKDDLEELGVSAQLHEDLENCVFGAKRTSIEHRIQELRPRLPQLQQFKWRVDVAISTSVLNRVLEPSIIMEMTFSNGATKSFEVPVSQFHQFRYSVAYVLKQMEDLEKRSILKIKD